ncbi:hypothetical protein [Streptomyces sp. NPDC058632]|uniref:hypothetical protein n=1 Tax=Streptomyces sp. NPDC058632 TaxID=3346567 RepID=UPI00365B9B50
MGLQNPGRCGGDPGSARFSRWNEQARSRDEKGNALRAHDQRHPFRATGTADLHGRIVPDTSCTPHDEGEPWVSPTAEEALRLAGLLLFQAAAVEPEPVGRPGVAEVVPIVGDAFEMRIRGHVPTVGQPLSDGG